MSTRQKQCLEALKANGPLSAMEVARYLHERGYSKLFERNIAQPRLKELIDQGLVVKHGKKWDSDTERNVTVYRIKEVLLNKMDNVNHGRQPCNSIRRENQPS